MYAVTKVVMYATKIHKVFMYFWFVLFFVSKTPTQNSNTKFQHKTPTQKSNTKLQQKIPATFWIFDFQRSLPKKIRQKTPLFIFTKSKHFPQIQIFEILQKSCRKVAEKLQEFKISIQSVDILLTTCTIDTH